MKKLILSLAILTCVSVFAGDGWITDMDQAKKIAKEQNKTILVNFSGSDWCGWCKRLDKEVFSKSEFHDLSKDKLVLVQIDFPKYKKQDPSLQRANRDLQRKYGVRGFPTVLLVSSNGRVLLQTGYRKGGPRAYIQHLDPYIN